MLLAYSKRYIRLSQTPLFVAYYARREFLIHLARAKCVGAGAVSYAQRCRLQAQAQVSFSYSSSLDSLGLSYKSKDLLVNSLECEMLIRPSFLGERS